MPKAPDKANVTAVIPIELKERLKEYAKARKWSLSTAMVTLIEQGLDQEKTPDTARRQG